MPAALCFAGIGFACCICSSHSRMLGRPVARSSSLLMKSERLILSRAARTFNMLCNSSGTSLICIIFDMSTAYKHVRRMSIVECTVHSQACTSSDRHGLHAAKSGLLFGLEQDARHIASEITAAARIRFHVRRTTAKGPIKTPEHPFGRPSPACRRSHWKHLAADRCGRPAPLHEHGA